MAVPIAAAFPSGRMKTVSGIEVEVSGNGRIFLKPESVRRLVQSPNVQEQVNAMQEYFRAKTMTDLEMTKQCAIALGYHPTHEETGGLHERCGWYCDDLYDLFEPLTNDAQAMALVKKFRLRLTPTITHGNAKYESWNVDGRSSDADLNRAIVECVAMLQVDRTAQETSTVATNK